MKWRHLLQAASTPTRESPAGPRELSRGKKLFLSSVTKIRKPLLFFFINWDTINACVWGRVGATGTGQLSLLCLGLCVACRNKGGGFGSKEKLVCRGKSAFLRHSATVLVDLEL